MTYRSTCDKYASDSEDNDEQDNPDVEDNFDEEDEHGVEDNFDEEDDENEHDEDDEEDPSEHTPLGVVISTVVLVISLFGSALIE